MTGISTSVPEARRHRPQVIHPASHPSHSGIPFCVPVARTLNMTDLSSVIVLTLLLLDDSLPQHQALPCRPPSTRALHSKQPLRCSHPSAEAQVQALSPTSSYLDFNATNVSDESDLISPNPRARIGSNYTDHGMEPHKDDLAR